jgi:transcriptional regulator with XRE-family HTH domain
MNRIKELREAAGLTLQELAEKADTSFQQVQRLEAGARRLTDKWMARLAPALGVQPHELMASTITPPSEEDSIGKRLEPVVIQLWRLISQADDRRVMEVVLRGMAPRGFKLPWFDEPGPTRHRKKK